MTNRYEALLVLNTQGKDDTLKEVVDRLESEFEKEGAKIEQVQKMDKRQFSYAAGELDAGYYVNFVFTCRSAADCEIAGEIQTRSRGLSPAFSTAEAKK